MSEITETVKDYITSSSFKRDQLMDKLSEFVTVERGGIKLYEAALKLVRNREVKDKFRLFHKQTIRHEEILTGIIEKLVAAGITTVEQVADMTPEQLEEIPGVGPKTVEKISIAVNNYFASLDAVPVEEGAAISDETAPAEEQVASDEASIVEEGEIAGEVAALQAEGEEAAAEGEEASGEGEEEVPLGAEDGPPDTDTQSGDLTGLSKEPVDSDESVEELVEEGQYFEAEVVDGVENAPPADEAEVHIHERPVVEGENVPDEELPGEQR